MIRSLRISVPHGKAKGGFTCSCLRDCDWTRTRRPEGWSCDLYFEGRTHPNTALRFLFRPAIGRNHDKSLDMTHSYQAEIPSMSQETVFSSIWEVSLERRTCDLQQKLFPQSWPLGYCCGPHATWLGELLDWFCHFVRFPEQVQKGSQVNQGRNWDNSTGSFRKQICTMCNKECS
jgi:hypothetical protein